MPVRSPLRMRMTPHCMTVELEMRMMVAAMMTGVTPNSVPSGGPASGAGSWPGC